MALQRAILQLGAGVSLHGGDYTGAALRAIDDANSRSSLTFLRSLDIDPATVEATVTIGVQRPDRVDAEAFKAGLPYSRITVKIVKGGLDVPNPENNDITVIASAGIAVHIAV